MAYNDRTEPSKGTIVNKMNIFKTATGVIASASAGAVVGNAIKATTPIDIKTSGKVMVAIGGFVLTSMVGDFASKYTSEQIDDVVENLKSHSDSTDN